MAGGCPGRGGPGGGGWLPRGPEPGGASAGGGGGAGGFRSVCAAVHGKDPDVTWPSGLQAPAMDTDGIPECLDYIWIRGALRATDARLIFDRPAADAPPPSPPAPPRTPPA